MKTKRAQFIKPGDTVRWEGSTFKVQGVAELEGFSGKEYAVIGGWVDGFTVMGDVLRWFMDFDDTIEVEGDWTREELDEVINRRFPNRLLTFYTEGANEVAAVEDGDGNMYRVWADDDTEFYKRNG